LQKTGRACKAVELIIEFFKNLSDNDNQLLEIVIVCYQREIIKQLTSSHETTLKEKSRNQRK
jgi:hypothetical protein